jgi:putative ABC transport system ATP-binding protein
MLLRAKQLHHHYQKSETPVHALRGIDWEVAQGEFWALMGPSGCGKSTLLHLCGAMEPPVSGTLTLANVPLHSASDEELTKLRREKIGFIFQAFNLLPTLTVVENVALPLRLAGQSHSVATKRAETYLERVGLPARARHFPSQLSGGERQRVAIARALVHEPLLVIADEPTGSLDSENGQRVVELLQEINRTLGVTILMATHDPMVAAAAAKLLRLKDGHVEGKPTV